MLGMTPWRTKREKPNNHPAAAPKAASRVRLRQRILRLIHGLPGPSEHSGVDWFGRFRQRSRSSPRLCGSTAKLMHLFGARGRTSCPGNGGAAFRSRQWPSASDHQFGIGFQGLMPDARFNPIARLRTCQQNLPRCQAIVLLPVFLGRVGGGARQLDTFLVLLQAWRRNR